MVETHKRMPYDRRTVYKPRNVVKILKLQEEGYFRRAFRGSVSLLTHLSLDPQTPVHENKFLLFQVTQSVVTSKQPEETNHYLHYLFMCLLQNVRKQNEKSYLSKNGIAIIGHHDASHGVQKHLGPKQRLYLSVPENRKGKPVAEVSV